MTRYTFTLLVCRIIAVLGALGFAQLVYNGADQVGLGLNGHATGWQIACPFALVTCSLALTLGGWLCWPLAPRLATCIAEPNDQASGSAPISCGVIIIGSYLAGLQILSLAFAHDIYRWRSIQLWGSIQSWELEFTPNLDQSKTLPAILGVAICFAAIAFAISQTAAREFQMSEKPSFHIARRDLGFVIARALAVLCLINAVGAFSAVFTEAIRAQGLSHSRYRGFIFSYDLIGHGIVYSLAMAFAAAWLWSRSGAVSNDQKTDEREPVTLGRTSLFQGVLAATGVYYCANGIPTLALWFYDGIDTRPGMASITSSQMVEAIVDMVVAAVLLIWAAILNGRLRFMVDDDYADEPALLTDTSPQNS